MASMNAKFKKILKDIENNIKNQDDLEYIKTQIFEMYNMFFEELTKLEEVANSKTSKILEVQARIR